MNGRETFYQSSVQWMMKKMQLEIWTDGACRGNPGPGGWAYRIIVRQGIKEKIIDGQSRQPYPSTTNNQMELKAILNAIQRAFKLGAKPAHIKLYCDSEWAVKCILGVYNCCKDKSTEHCKILQQIWRLDPNKEISFNHVRSHRGINHNEVVDQLARKSIKSVPNQ